MFIVNERRAPNTLQVGAKISIGASFEDEIGCASRPAVRRAPASRATGSARDRPRAELSRAREFESLRQPRCRRTRAGGGQGAAPGGGPGGQLHSRARPSLSASPPRGVIGLTLPIVSLLRDRWRAFRPRLDLPQRSAPSPWSVPRRFFLINVPMIEYTLEFLASNGVEEVFVFCAREQIVEYIEKSAERRARLRRAHHRLHKLHQRRRGDAPDRPPPRRPRGFHPRERRRRRQHGLRSRRTSSDARRRSSPS